MPLTRRERYQNPDFWHIWGHSYVAGAVGSIDQTGRVDSILRGAFDTEANNFQNHAVSGARVTIRGRSTGGWTRVMQEKVPSLTRAAPYAPDGGAGVLFWGINDIGLLGNTTQMRTAYTNALRAVISRHRASTVWEDTNAKFTYGAGFTQLAGTEDIGSGTSCRQATTTTAATITLTLPADYNGEVVTLQFWGVAHDTGGGGTVTFSGTAGVTGTLSTSAAMPAATLSQVPIVRRVTNLTSANAGQTIIATVTSLDAGGTVYFDCAWLEAKAAPAVLVCNINRLTASGYAFYGGWSGTEGTKDSDVQAWNTAITNVVAEFDSMVQLVDIDALIGKNTALTSDGIHPNEYGAALIVDAMIDALRRITPPSTYGVAASINAPSPRGGQLMRTRRSGFWYTADASRGTGTSYSAVLGDLWAIPIIVTGARERWVQLSMEVVAAGTVSSAIRWGLYDDIGGSGYPQCLVNEATAAGGPFTVALSAGVKTSPASGTGSISWVVDPGLYWLVLKVTTGGTGQTYRSLAGPSLQMPNLTATGAASVMPSGWKLTGQGSTALPGTFPLGAALSDNAPIIGVLMA